MAKNVNELWNNIFVVWDDSFNVWKIPFQLFLSRRLPGIGWACRKLRCGDFSTSEEKVPVFSQKVVWREKKLSRLVKRIELLVRVTSIPDMDEDLVPERILWPVCLIFGIQYYLVVWAFKIEFFLTRKRARFLKLLFFGQHKTHKNIWIVIVT